ncbi:unnamed protein product [Echinostoma caproni]|uniref:Uncharacterized protein n=1 Tax=Echinostoma caproni TaxID=27848 RepID=A0A183A3J3_9TREM|nr:unnamed protein product [Echinostoma caproni]
MALEQSAHQQPCASPRLNDTDNTDSASTESLEVIEVVEKPYNWPDLLINEHNYFHVPEIGAKIRYRSVVSRSMRRAQRQQHQRSITPALSDRKTTGQPSNSELLSRESSRKRGWLSPNEQSGDDGEHRFNTPYEPAASWLFHNKRPHLDPEGIPTGVSKLDIGEEDEYEEQDEITSSDRHLGRRPLSPVQQPTQLSPKRRIRGNRELASLFTPVLKSELHRAIDSPVDQTNDRLVDPTHRIPSARFKQRTSAEEDYVSLFFPKSAHSIYFFSGVGGERCGVGIFWSCI